LERIHRQYFIGLYLFPRPSTPIYPGFNSTVTKADAMKRLSHPQSSFLLRIIDFPACRGSDFPFGIGDRYTNTIHTYATSCLLIPSPACRFMCGVKTPSIGAPHMQASLQISCFSKETNLAEKKKSLMRRKVLAGLECPTHDPHPSNGFQFSPKPLTG